MDEETGHNLLSDRGLESLLALLAAPARRVMQAEIDGVNVWIKRYERHHVPFAKRLHGFASPVLFPAFLKSSPLISPRERVDRELRKAAAFAAAGFRVPEIVYRRGAVLVMKDAAPTLLQGLKAAGAGADGARERDRLLAGACATLGRAHRAGLCHGRPHPRDMLFDPAIEKGVERWGFIDFEEEPEAAMPLADAQARDVWLLFFQVAAGASGPHAAEEAFEAYRDKAPAPALHALARLVGFFAPLAAIGRAAARIHRGGDLDRFLKAMDILSRVPIGGGRGRGLEADRYSDLRPGDQSPDETGRAAARRQDQK